MARYASFDQPVPNSNSDKLDGYHASAFLPHVTNTDVTPYNVLTTDICIYVDATAGSKIINLPIANGTGRILTIKKIAGVIGNTVTITANTGGTPDMIDGNPTVVLTTVMTSVTIQDGIINNWYIN